MDILSGVRNRSIIGPYYHPLERRGFPPEVALSLARGYATLKAYPGLLNDKGRQLLSEANEVMTSNRPAGDETIANRTATLSPQLPSAHDPKLALFASPAEAVKTEADNFINNDKLNHVIVLELSDGCYNLCLDCSLSPSSSMTHMPYPMVMAIAQEILLPLAEKQKPYIIWPYFRSDPMHYADRHWDVDFGDVALRLITEMGLKLELITHGWASGDHYAEQAAQKLFTADIRFNHLSVHLLHRQLQMHPDKVEDYVTRFRSAIKLLRPKVIRLKGQPQEMPGPEIFTLSYLEKLFNERIAPPEKYSGETERYIPYYEGRALDVPAANIFYDRNSVITPDLNILRFSPVGDFFREETAHKDPVAMSTVGQVFSGPDDLKFRAFAYFLLDTIDSFYKYPDHHEFFRATHHPVLEGLKRFFVFKTEFRHAVFSEIGDADFSELFAALNDLPLPFTDFYPVATLGEWLHKFWGKMENKYPELNHDFNRFLIECLREITPQYNNNELLDRDGRFIGYEWAGFNKSKVLDTKDKVEIRYLLDYRMKAIRSFRQRAQIFLADYDANAVPHEGAREIFELIADLPVLYHTGFGINVRGSRLAMPRISPTVEFRPIKPPGRAFPK